jgi:hypothetical protein
MLFLLFRLEDALPGSFRSRLDALPGLLCQVLLGDDFRVGDKVLNDFPWEALSGFCEVNNSIDPISARPVTYIQKRTLPDIVTQGSWGLPRIAAVDNEVHVRQVRKFIRPHDDAVLRVVLAVVFALVTLQSLPRGENFAAICAGKFTAPLRLAAEYEAEAEAYLGETARAEASSSEKGYTVASASVKGEGSIVVAWVKSDFPSVIDRLRFF